MSEERITLERVPPANAILKPQNNYLEPYYPDGSPYGSSYGKQGGIAILREWRRIIYRHKWLILSIVLVAMPFIVIQAYRAKSIYQATATIEVRREESSLAKGSDVYYYDAYDNTKSEAFIIKSQPVIKNTVVSLKLDRDSRFLDVTTKRSVWEAILAIKGRLGLERKAAKESGREVGAVDSPVGQDAILSHKKELQKESPESQADRARLAPYIGALGGNLKVEGVRDTRLMKLSFTHTDPEIAAAVANGVADSFIKHNFQAKTARFTDTSSWLEESTRKLKAQVEQAEAALANYSRLNNIFSLEGKENLTAEKLVRLHDQVMRAETDLLLKQSLYEEVKRGRVAQLPEAFADPKTAELRKSLNELAVTASQVGVKFGAKHPRLIELRQQMNTIQEQIDANRSMLEERLKADYERAVREEDSLKAALNQAKTEAVQQNQAAIQYSVLQQDLVTAKSLYTDFLNKTSQANIQRAEQYNNVRLIEAAEPPGGPVGPNRAQAIMIGFLISLAFGVGLAYLLERLNTTVRNVEDVSRATQLPTLAVIPSLEDKSLPAKRKVGGELKDASDEIAQVLDPSAKAILADTTTDFSAATESYRMLRTSVLLSTAEHPPKTILVTSGQPGDGKTTTVYNTAIAFTQLKAQVLVIDCDMRKPRIHSMARIKREQGLSTFLSSGGNLSELIKQTPMPYLSILPCGHIPPNPSELISSDKMKEMLSFLSEHYDYIFIDSPPLVTVTDPLILSTLVDGVILVVKSGKSKSEIARRACQDLSGVGAKILGVVLNDLNVRHEGYDYYNYSRYYSDYIDHAKSNGAGA